MEGDAWCHRSLIETMTRPSSMLLSEPRYTIKVAPWLLLAKIALRGTSAAEHPKAWTPLHLLCSFSVALGFPGTS